jgi:hypothetical protein
MDSKAWNEREATFGYTDGVFILHLDSMKFWDILFSLAFPNVRAFLVKTKRAIVKRTV